MAKKKKITKKNYKKKKFYKFTINSTKIAIVKNNIAIRIAGKVSRYIDASMNRATHSDHRLRQFIHALMLTPVRVLPSLTAAPEDVRTRPMCDIGVLP